MRLSRIHIDTPLSTGQSVPLPVDRAHYVKNVLRLRNGQQILLFNGKESLDHLAQLCIESKHVSAQLLSSIPKSNDPCIDICLIQALGRSEHNDFVIQKGTELGVSHFILFNAERTQSPLKSNRLDKKLSHWKSITISASEQCNRNIIPQITFSRSLEDCLPETSSGNGILLDFEGEKFSQIAQRLKPVNPLYIVIGPEGGFNPQEIQRLTDSELLTCNIGPRVLRMESAAISAITLMQHYLGDM
jgi:16S rRNA (uracil1498-N3)-methyltransferase